MNSDLVLIATNVMQEITKIINIKSEECATILSVNDTTILAGIQYNQKPLLEKDRLKVLRKIKKLEKIFKINHIITNSRSILFQGETKIK